jgi:hypothetical protein
MGKTILNEKERVLSLKTVPSTFWKAQFSITAIFRPGSVLKIQRKKSSWSLQWEKSIGNLQEFERKNLHLLSLQPYIRLVKANWDMCLWLDVQIRYTNTCSVSSFVV